MTVIIKHGPRELIDGWLTETTIDMVTGQTHYSPASKTVDPEIQAKINAAVKAERARLQSERWLQNFFVRLLNHIHPPL